MKHQFILVLICGISSIVLFLGGLGMLIVDLANHCKGITDGSCTYVPPATYIMLSGLIPLVLTVYFERHIYTEVDNIE